ncbi:hypothetical protein NE601_17420, partial [Erysipelatoclostridium ramosum]|nr:hypothetical protein [Thomasclavelia ramosa]
VDNKSSYYDKDCVQEKDITENLGALQINNQESEEDELNDTGVSSVKLDVKSYNSTPEASFSSPSTTFASD